MTPKKDVVVITPTKEANKKPNEKKESKSEVFIRLAELRVKSVLNSFRILGNCGSRVNYDYTQEQVNEITASIDNAYANLLAKFTPSKQEQTAFTFSKK